MPIYEYEPIDYDCLICGGRFEALQGIHDEPLPFCPTCGLDCRRVISKASIKIATPTDADRAAKKGLTTFRRAEKGVWEKVAGPGVDVIQGSAEEIASVEAEKKTSKPKKLELP
ncbi:MAG TPA: zinc ribbon domain-containing protein [Fimbriimonadaceae bacterium]|nr:zinc ribbon domain-containing protein [Fimbriimonadaceae bacterium]